MLVFHRLLRQNDRIEVRLRLRYPKTPRSLALHLRSEVQPSHWNLFLRWENHWLHLPLGSHRCFRQVEVHLPAGPHDVALRFYTCCSWRGPFEKVLRPYRANSVPQWKAETFSSVTLGTVFAENQIQVQKNSYLEAIMRITGFDAISFAEREGLTLNKSADSIDGPADGLTIAEAEAIATIRPDLIWLDVSQADYFGEPKNMRPSR